MQRFQTSSPLAVQVNDVNSPELATLSADASGVPSSFADWLSQPACSIVADAEPEQGTFVGLMNQCAAQNISRPPARPFRC